MGSVAYACPMSWDCSARNQKGTFIAESAFCYAVGPPAPIKSG